jgi:hypothetical protein
VRRDDRLDRIDAPNGSGVRFILASGFVVRLDLATGSEGTQPTLIFQYPWAVF